jgi:hypothetical protein
MAFRQTINISIASGTAAVQRAGFRPLIVGTDVAEITEIVAASLTDVTGAGYLTTDNEYKMAAAMFAQNPRPTEITIYRKANATAWDTALDTLLTRITPANDFWSVCISSRVKADLNTVGTWAGSNTRFFFGCVDDVTAGSGRNIDREAYLISDTPAEFPECAWVGEVVPQAPGSASFKWKHPSGITAAGYTTTQFGTIFTNNTQAPQNQGGVIFINEGLATSGEYIDVTWGADWVKTELEAEILSLMLNNPKISLDNVGIGRVESAIRKVLDAAGNAGIIAVATDAADQLNSDDNVFQYKVSVPARSEISAGDLAARSLTGVTFSYIIAGAIHAVTINGVINIT